MVTHRHDPQPVQSAGLVPWCFIQVMTREALALSAIASSWGLVACAAQSMIFWMAPRLMEMPKTDEQKDRNHARHAGRLHDEGRKSQTKAGPVCRRNVSHFRTMAAPALVENEMGHVHGDLG